MEEHLPTLLRVLPKRGAKGELVYLGRRPGDVNADMLDVLHGSAFLRRAGSNPEDEEAKPGHHSRLAC
jgi:hypothetical protein